MPTKGLHELRPGVGAEARPSALARLARFGARRPGYVLTAWALIVAIALLGVARYGLNFADRLDVPGTESQHATDVIAASFPSRGSEATVVVATGDDRPIDPSALASLGLDRRIRAIPHVTDIGPAVPSPDGRALLATIALDGLPHVVKDSTRAMTAIAAERHAGYRVAFGGEAISQNTSADAGRAEIIGLACAFVVLVLAFRSLVAALLPLVTAIVSSTLGMVVIGLVGHRVDVGASAPTIASMLGLGVGIDYALFYLTRVREEMTQGASIEAAIVRSADTSGRAIVFAGASVVVALLGLSRTGVGLIVALGAACAFITLVSVGAAITLLPALVRITSRFVAPSAASTSSTSEGATFGRLARAVARRPVVFALAATAVLLALSAPTLRLQLGFPDDGAQPAGTSARRAYDLVAEHFGAGMNGPLVVVVEDPTQRNLALGAIPAIGADPEVAVVIPASASADGAVTLLALVPRHAPEDPAVAALVHRLRDSTAPGLVAAAGGGRISVGGSVALTIDVSELIAAKLPAVISAVLVATLLLLLIVFRSVLVPVKAVLMNLLSVASAYGVLVIVFQWGVGRELLGLERAIPIVSVVPLLLFALLFGLSMDYEVFLLARVREEHDAGHDGRESVARALARTGRVITSAALIMVAVFVAFALGNDPIVKMFGVGLAAAILVDATLIRVVLVPATMVLLGRANWWLPSWLDRVLPRVRLE